MSKTRWLSLILACLCLPPTLSAQESPSAPSPPSAPDVVPPEPPAPTGVAPAAPPDPGLDPSASPALAAAPPPQPSAAEPAAAEAPAEPEPEYPLLRFKGRIMTGVEVEREHPENGQAPADETQAEWFLEQAVIEAEAQLSKRLDVELGFNVRTQTLRDAWINYRVEDEFQVRVGRFKRPFSRLELRSRGKLPFRERGLFNDEVLSQHGFAGRTLGGMIWGKATDQLRYYVAGTSPTEIGTGIEGVDIIARVVYEPIPELSFGVNGLHKWSERFADGEDLSVSGVGADARFELGPLDVHLEFDAVQNPGPPAAPGATDPSRTPWALGFIAWGEYAFKLSKKWTIAPVVVFEWMDTDTEYSQDETVRAVIGLSWNYRKNFLRVMPQVEIIRPLGEASTRSEVASETYYVMVATDI